MTDGWKRISSKAMENERVGPFLFSLPYFPNVLAHASNLIEVATGVSGHSRCSSETALMH